MLPLVSEVITPVTDREHTVPVRVQRTGQRAVVVGTGQAMCWKSVSPVNVDIKAGRHSGIQPGRRHLSGRLPVAGVKIDHPGSLMFARIHCAPMGNVDQAPLSADPARKQCRFPAAPEPVVRKQSRVGKRGGERLMPVVRWSPDRSCAR